MDRSIDLSIDLSLYLSIDLSIFCIQAFLCSWPPGDMDPVIMGHCVYGWGEGICRIHLRFF